MCAGMLLGSRLLAAPSDGGGGGCMVVAVVVVEGLWCRNRGRADCKGCTCYEELGLTLSYPLHHKKKEA